MITCSIVLYNNDKNILSKTITSCLNTQLNIVLFLIDNSPNNDLKELSNIFNVDYIHVPSNPGFGAAHNIAIKRAIEIGSQFHLVLNPDVFFDTGTLESIFDYMVSHPQVGNLMPKVLYPNGSIQFLCKLLPTPYDWIGRRFNPFKKLVEKRNIKFELRFSGYDRIMEVPYLSGCFMFLRIEAIRDVGFFDEGIFMYGEETDLCRRLINKGYKVTFFPEVSIFHEFQKGSHKSWRLTWIGIKSAIYYFNKWGWFFDSERKKINDETIKNITN
jgi:GT2 family glycosyltransferase